MQRLLLLFPFLIISAASVKAQPAPISNVQQYTTENGLPSNGIKGLQWDEKTELLWMSTEAGIVRFNGVDFTFYTKQNMPEIGSERMLFLVRNSKGRIYTSDQPGNIFVIDKNRPVLWRKALQVSRSVNPQVSQYFLLMTSDRIFENKIGKPKPAQFSLTSNRTIDISDSSCLVQSQATLYYFSVGVDEPVALPVEKDNIDNIFRIGNRIFIINKQREVFLLNPATLQATTVSGPGDGMKLLRSANSNSSFFWQPGMPNPFFIENEKAWLLTYEDNTINAQLISTNIPLGMYIRFIQYSEKNKILFIGSESKGMIVISRNRVLSRKRNKVNLNNRNSYYSQVELPNGNILTNESDIIGDKPTDKNKLPIKGKFSFNISTTGNSLWYSQYNNTAGHYCLHEFNMSTGKTKAYPAIKSGDIVTEAGGKIYIASLNGIGVLDGDSTFYLYKYSSELAGIVTFDFKPIAGNLLAVATCAGLLRFNIATNKLDTLFSKENICVRNIWMYKGYLFFGTYGDGFYIHKDGVTRLMPPDKNRYLLYPHCFVPDEEDYCWISTNRGLFKASLPDLIDAFENKRQSVYYHYYGKKDGMEMTELNGGCTPCALTLQDKTISFPTMDGLLWVNPEKARPVLPEGEVFIDEIQVNGEKINPDSVSSKMLPPRTDELIIKLGFSAWCNKENIYIDYRLKDSAWKPVNTDNIAMIRLNNLGSGSYVLQIRKRNGFGADNYTYRVISFSISTPWYKQWWFYLLCLSALVGIAQLILHIRTRQYKISQRRLERQVAEKTKELKEQNEILEKNDSIKTRLISIISHDIITPLKFLNVAGKNLMEKRNMMPEELQLETIREITNTSKELQLLSTNILNWIKYQNENRRLAKEEFHLHEMINQIFSVLNSMANQKNLRLVNHVHTGLHITQYFEPLKILIYNLITNAIHFSEKGEIIIKAVGKNEFITISVQDEGTGMTPDQIKNIMADQFIVSSANVDNKKGNGLGYMIIKDLLKMMGAKLSIISEKGKGTTVYVEVPK